jgi:hypothetical protein
MKIKTILISALIIVVGVSLFYLVPKSAAHDSGISFNNPPKNGVVAMSYTSSRFSVAQVQWQTIVNNSFAIPGTGIFYSSYGQPSVNSSGFVVFRARSTGGERQTGIYARQFPKGNVEDVADLETLVPYPNNLETVFSEFPSIPRIAPNTQMIATRGNHKPVYKYLLPDETETRVGTTGLYVQLNGGLFVNGASKLGLAPGFGKYAVPNTDPAVAFDVFPGAPAIADNGSIAFKGNYTVNNVGKTGIFFRDLLSTPGGGKSSVQLIANSDTEIPNAPPSFRAMTFGSTAPPTIAEGRVVFTGLDNEDDPHFGGIYMAWLTPNPQLRTLVGIDQQMPGVNVPGLSRIGEALSFDGRYVAFWGAWGNETKTVRLYCPEDGNADLLAYCNGVDPNSIFDETSGRWYQEKLVMLNQGIFIYDIYGDHAYMVSHTEGDFNDFTYWGYSGKPPGVGPEDDAEPPRWRSTAFLAVSDGIVAFKARTGLMDKNGVYINPIDGIYMRDAILRTPIETLAETGMDGEILDPSTPTGVGPTIPIVGLGIERDSFRGNKLAISASMANDVTSWGGIYMANVSRNGNLGRKMVKTSK